MTDLEQLAKIFAAHTRTNGATHQNAYAAKPWKQPKQTTKPKPSSTQDGGVKVALIVKLQITLTDGALLT